MAWKLGEKCRAMGGVERLVTTPKRWTGNVKLSRKVADFLPASVFVAAREPFGATSSAVEPKAPLVPTPHLGGWMIGPALRSARKCSEKLEDFDSLLAHALTIEAGGRLVEVWVREEGLHQSRTGEVRARMAAARAARRQRTAAAAMIGRKVIGREWR